MWARPAAIWSTRWASLNPMEMAGRGEGSRNLALPSYLDGIVPQK
jgi:hypothetical protein